MEKEIKRKRGKKRSGEEVEENEPGGEQKESIKGINTMD